jgi:3-hydroxybutyryl-CoA dehydratase
VNVSVGDTVTFRKTVGESDVYLFAGITGDLAPNHVDEVYMAATPYGKRIAHGLLVLGYCSTASTALLARIGRPGVSYGYDRVRFTAPVFIGDTVTVDYRVTAIDPEADTVVSRIEVTNQHSRLCLVANHILKLLPTDPAAPSGTPPRSPAG